MDIIISSTGIYAVLTKDDLETLGRKIRLTYNNKNGRYEHIEGKEDIIMDLLIYEDEHSIVRYQAGLVSNDIIIEAYSVEELAQKLRENGINCPSDLSGFINRLMRVWKKVRIPLYRIYLQRSCVNVPV